MSRTLWGGRTQFDDAANRLVFIDPRLLFGLRTLPLRRLLLRPVRRRWSHRLKQCLRSTFVKSDSCVPSLKFLLGSPHRPIRVVVDVVEPDTATSRPLIGRDTK